MLQAVTTAAWLSNYEYIYKQVTVETAQDRRSIKPVGEAKKVDSASEYDIGHLRSRSEIKELSVNQNWKELVVEASISIGDRQKTIFEEVVK